jgi:hypothetical protein
LVKYLRTKIFADKNICDNNIGGTKMPSCGMHKGILVPPILFPFGPPIYLSANILNFAVTKITTFERKYDQDYNFERKYNQHCNF